MANNPIVIYGIGGLGADHRVFQNLNLSQDIRPIIWIDPMPNETFKSYAERVAQQVDQTQKYALLGVSFGGMLAVELNSFLKPEFTVLISSAAQSTDLPQIRKLAKIIVPLRYLPSFLLKPPMFVMNFLFGTKNKKLLKRILDDTDSNFIRWALERIVGWQSTKKIDNLHLIHGSKDRMIPLTDNTSTIVKGGGHFMIVDQADEISEILNEIIGRYEA